MIHSVNDHTDSNPSNPPPLPSPNVPFLPINGSPSPPPPNGSFKAGQYSSETNALLGSGSFEEAIKQLQIATASASPSPPPPPSDIGPTSDYYSPHSSPSRRTTTSTMSIRSGGSIEEGYESGDCADHEGENSDLDDSDNETNGIARTGRPEKEDEAEIQEEEKEEEEEVRTPPPSIGATTRPTVQFSSNNLYTYDQTDQAHLEFDYSTDEGDFPEPGYLHAKQLPAAQFGGKDHAAMPLIESVTDADGNALAEERPSAEERPYTGMFEGPEKTLEVCFREKDGSFNCRRNTAADPFKNGTNDQRCAYPIKALRTLPPSSLHAITSLAHCRILSSVSNAHLDAYVLSESSLFVYPYMLTLKTCGTTTLLRCVSAIVSLASRIGLVLDWVGYSRKNFSFPQDQLFPHTSFDAEISYIQRHRDLLEGSLLGNGYTLGPITGDHWFVWVADRTIRGRVGVGKDGKTLSSSSSSSNFDELEAEGSESGSSYRSTGMNEEADRGMDSDRVINIMMFDIDEKVAAKFYYDKYKIKEEEESRGDGDGEDDNIEEGDEGEEEGDKDDESRASQRRKRRKKAASASKKETLESENRRISREMTQSSGISALCPGSLIDPRAFEPCGYSMNAILYAAYTTMHITPEETSSYASFETNMKLLNYQSLISNVVRTFRPKRFVLTLMGDEGGVAEIKENPLDGRVSRPILVPKGSSASATNSKVESANAATLPPGLTSTIPLMPSTWCYRRASLASIQIEDDCVCMMGNFVLDEELGTSVSGEVGTNRRLGVVRGQTIS